MTQVKQEIAANGRVRRMCLNRGAEQVARDAQHSPHTLRHPAGRMPLTRGAARVARDARPAPTRAGIPASSAGPRAPPGGSAPPTGTGAPAAPGPPAPLAVSPPVAGGLVGPKRGGTGTPCLSSGPAYGIG